MTELLVGDQVKHIRNGDVGKIVKIHRTYNPLTRETSLMVTFVGEKEWWANGSELEKIDE